MKTKVFTSDELRDLKVAAIARKHKCSVDYVRRVLLGDRERNTDLAKLIVVDATDMFAIIERETKVTA